jgi:hypothetical protein
MADAAALGLMLSNLPGFLGIIQTVVYIGFVLFFGSVAVVGFRAYIHWTLKLLLRVVTGIVALICGIALSPLLPGVSGGLFSLFQLDIIIGGVVAAAVIAAGLYLITFGMVNAERIENAIASLNRKLEEARTKEKTQKSEMIKIGGVVILAILLIISLFNFHGFPNIMDQIAPLLGTTPEELTRMI